MFTNLKFPKALEERKKNKILLVDTDVLSDISKNGPSKQIEVELLQRGVILLYSLTSIMELGFGPTDLTTQEEERFYKSLYLRKNAINKDIFVTQFSVKYKLKELESLRGKWVAVSPDSHNWYAAKQTLVAYMNDKRDAPQKALKLQVDALLSCAAWNAGAFLWTNNIKDHLLATYYTMHSLCTRNRDKQSEESLKCIASSMVPIFDTELLIRVIAGESFNIFYEMKKKTKDHQIIQVLEIAENLL